MRRKHRTSTLSLSPEPKRKPSAETVPRNPEALHAQLVAKVRDGLFDAGVDGLGPVVGQELLDVPARLVEIGGRGRAGEEVWGYGEEAGAGEAVGETVVLLLGGFCFLGVDMSFVLGSQGFFFLTACSRSVGCRRHR